MKTTPQNARQPLVVAVVATDQWAGRAELRGISAAARGRGWTLETIDLVNSGSDYAPYRGLLGRADGVIARLYDSLANGTLASLGVPIVGIDAGRVAASGRRTALPPGIWARVMCNQDDVADAAAAELLATGRKHFVFVPMLRRYPWTGTRGKAFLDRIREAGCSAWSYEPVTDWAWVKERENLARWLAGIPRPFGIFAGNDLLAKFALDSCRTAGLSVPHDAAIVGADDDETFCLTASPTLTSVRLDFEGAGRLAVDAIASLLGKRKPPRPKLFRYGILGVTRRDSTRTIGKDVDLRLAAGLDFIAAHAHDPMVGVRDVAAAMGLGRRQADRLFAVTGTSIRRHVEEARLASAKTMLRGGADTVAKIASACGFSSSNYFIRIFRSRFGVTPACFRSGAR